MYDAASLAPVRCDDSLGGSAPAQVVSGVFAVAIVPKVLLFLALETQADCCRPLAVLLKETESLKRQWPFLIDRSCEYIRVSQDCAIQEDDAGLAMVLQITSRKTQCINMYP